jgi:hypothetical protein
MVRGTWYVCVYVLVHVHIHIHARL